MAAMLITSPVRGAFGRMNCDGTTISRPSPGSQGSTLGLARTISSYPTLKRRAISLSVSSLLAVTTCTADDVLSGVELEALVGHGRGQRRRRRRGRRWGRRRVPKRGEERAPRDQQARQRGSGAGRGGNLHGGIMTEFAGARRASVMRYSSTGWLGSSWSLWCRP